eukprot:m.253469 g.253469  ORF g.253469 m.253469 type:complete len:281 (-) comp19584_c0_seq18:331-1173(-)
MMREVLVFLDFCSLLMIIFCRYFTAVDLAVIAQQLDEQERAHMAEHGEDTPAYIQFMSQESGNYDDSGFFSSQVISKALSTFGLELSPIGSRNNTSAREHPERQIAFVCWLNAHWFTIRKMEQSGQWYNLDSNLAGPAFVSELYLQLLLQQMQAQGYTVFVVSGNLPRVSSDAFVSLPASDHIRDSASAAAASGPHKDLQPTSEAGFCDEDLQAAIAMSLAGSDTTAAAPDRVEIQAHSIASDVDDCTEVFTVWLRNVLAGYPDEFSCMKMLHVCDQIQL